MLRPEIVQLTANGGDQGEYWVGAPEWNATAIERARVRFYGFNEVYNLTTSQAALEYARVSDAIKTGAPIFWACDAASDFIFPKGSVVMLKEPPHDPGKWHPVLPSQDPDWYKKSVVDTSWPPVTVSIAYAKHLQTDLPEGARFLNHVKFTADMIGSWTYATFTEKKDVDSYARNWVRDNAATVNAWLAR
jgi:glycine betaine/proline transport system substrate-binding protein